MFIAQILRDINPHVHFTVFQQTSLLVLTGGKIYLPRMKDTLLVGGPITLTGVDRVDDDVRYVLESVPSE